MNKVRRLRHFLGKESFNFLILSSITGLSWFFVEASFVYVFQIFLAGLGLISSDQTATFLNGYRITPIIGIIALILYGTLRFVVNFSKHVLASYLQHSFIRKKRSEIYNVGLDQAGRIPTGLILSMFSETVSQAGTVLFHLSNAVVSGIATILLIIFGLSTLPKEMFISLSLLAIFIFPYKFMSNRIQMFGKVLIHEWEMVNRNMISALRNNMFLKIHNLDHHEYEKGVESLKKYEHSYKRYTWYSALISIIPPFYGLLIIAGISFMFMDKHIHEPFTLITFIYIFMRMAQSASETLGTLAYIKLNMPGFKKIWEWSDFKLKQKTNKSELIDKLAEIKFENVHFAYPDGRKVIQNLSFSLKKGDVLTIKGESGSGKSTLLSLLLGLNSQTSGNIFVNGKNSSEMNLSNILGYVGPTPYLIDASIRDNINFSHNTHFSDEKIKRVLDQVMLNNILSSAGLDEILLEDAQLSTGQKQRLCMVRALISEPQLLVLDEATANLDSDSEAAVISSIKSGVAERITIIVTHKDSFDSLSTKTIKL